MQYSDTSTNQGIVQQIRFDTKTNSTDFPIEDITRLANIARDYYFTIAMDANNLWDIDDTTYSTYNTATTNLVSGQRDYQMPANLIDILQVRVLDTSGNLRVLKPIDQEEFQGALEEIFETDSDPIYYEKKGDGIFLFPASNYNSTSGLEIDYKRQANPYLTTDTTRASGLPVTHDMYICKYVAHQYASSHNFETAAIKEKELEAWVKKIQKYWSKRGKDKKVNIKFRYESSR